MFKKMPHVPMGPFKCPTCGTLADFHCRPWVAPVGSQARTGSIQCTWRRCPKCRSFGQPGGRWISPNPEPTEPS